MFDRRARSCFYEAGKNFDGYLPLGAPTPEVVERAHETLRAYDETMHRVELHAVMSLMDDFIRFANKHWTEGIRQAELADDQAARRQVLVDSFYLLWVATLLMHPVVPFGTEKICDYLNFEFDEFFSWNYDFEGMDELCSAGEITEGRHRVRDLPPRFDFFERHPSQAK